MQESLSLEHGGELLVDSFEELLDGGRVGDEGGGHLLALRGNITDRGFDVVGDPIYEVGGALVLDVQHLLINVLGSDVAAEHGRGGQVAALARIAGSHHVLGVEHLRSKLGNSDVSVADRLGGSERGVADHEEVKAGEGHKVDGELAEIGVELARETKAASDTAHDLRDQVVQVTVVGVGEFESTEADVIQGLVIDTHYRVGVFDELVNRQGSVVGLYYSVGHLGRGHDRECAHHSVRVFLADLRDQKGTHTRASTTAK